MDPELLAIVNPSDVATKQGDLKLDYVNVAAGEMRVIDHQGQTLSYTLKPLRDLYGQGNHTDSIDPESHTFMPLFLTIETEIANYYAGHPSLTDGRVALVLEELAIDPDTPATDLAAQQIQMGLRLCLSMNNYSRQEVRAALRKIKKSVDRHTRVDGPRGYLDFIIDYVGPKR